jgi:CheY-like chemotaxis protein
MSTHKTTLLLVDDDDALRHLLSLILAKSGYKVRSAKDGFSALAAIREEVPEILLSDLFMPGMSGFELLSVVRRKFPMIPVIATSSAYSGPDVPPGVAADAFYEKATDLNALLGIVNGIHYLPDGRSPSARSSVTPIWIAREAKGSADEHIVLACPECMRTFPLLHAETLFVIREASCLYCSTLIPYALVQAAALPSSEDLLEGLRARVQTQLA